MRVVVLDELHVAYPPQVEVDAAVLDAVAVVPVPAAPHANLKSRLLSEKSFIYVAKTIT